MINIRVRINANAISEIESILEQRFERVGQFVENKAKESCPVDSGILRASVHHEADKTGTVIGTNVEYAISVHEGHGSFSGVPFLRDAVYGNMSEINNLLGGN